MPPRSAANDAAMFAEAESHGGLVALQGGPAHACWLLRDQFLGQPEAAWNRDGYVETRETVQNPGPELRGYGPATVWRFDPEAVSARQSAAGQADPLPVQLCGCGDRLLLLAPGRVLCERCRIERGLPHGWWRDAAAA
jgi:hypothetical protein